MSNETGLQELVSEDQKRMFAIAAEEDPTPVSSYKKKLLDEYSEEYQAMGTSGWGAWCCGACP